jgi:hypothetical protein
MNRWATAEPALPGWWRPLEGEAPKATGGGYFNQPRLRKYHIGTRALAIIRLIDKG